MHLVDELVGRVLQLLEVVIRRGPGHCRGPRVALCEDVLRVRAGGTDGGDGGLVEVEDQCLVNVVVLIVGVEDDLVVGLEGSR